MSGRQHQARKASSFAAGLRAGTFDPGVLLERIKAIDHDGAVRGAPGDRRPTTAELAERAALVWVLGAHGWELERDDETGRLYVTPKAPGSRLAG